MMIRRSAACRCVRTSSSVFKLNQTCFVESSLVMRHGDNGNQAQICQWMSPTSPRPKKARQSESKVKVMLSRSSMSEASSTVSSCHRARRTKSKSTKRSCGFCFAQCTRRYESCDRTNRGCFTTNLLTTP